MDQNRVFKGITAAPGFAAGTAFVWQEARLELPEGSPSQGVQAGVERIEAAIEKARDDLVQIRKRVADAAGEQQAAIFDAHMLILEDSTLHTEVKDQLEQGANPEAAWHTATEKIAAILENLPDETLSARAIDLRDIGQRVLAHLLGQPVPENRLNVPSVVIARDLTPSETALLDHSLVLAFCTAGGGPTSHTAILAKAMGIPAIVALGEEILLLSGQDFTLVDTSRGELIVNPTEDQKEAFVGLFNRAKEQQASDLDAAHDPAVTTDGVQVEVFANIGSVSDAHTAIRYGAEGVGLFRTEFLYLNQASLPSTQQQVETYRAVFETLAGRPLVVRTLDIGGDKQIASLGIVPEPNPFLGWRGIRTVGERPELLRDQFHAILLAAGGREVRIMLPMVSQVDEVIAARALFEEALQSLQRDPSLVNPAYQFGIMVEVPATALTVEHFAPHVDFFSLGTNDLTQYTLAVDRMNARVAPLASPFHPAVLNLVARTVRVAHQNGKWVGMCGEFAGDPLAIPFLLGIGLDEFSMAATLIPEAKRIIRQLSVEDCKQVANQALKMGSAEEARSLLQAELDRLTA